MMIIVDFVLLFCLRKILIMVIVNFVLLFCFVRLRTLTGTREQKAFFSVLSSMDTYSRRSLEVILRVALEETECTVLAWQ